VFASAQMILQFHPHFGGHRVVDQVVEHRQEFTASHFSTPVFLRK
jgi:hypothetical protein